MRILRPLLVLVAAVVASVVVLTAFGPWTRGPEFSSDKKFDIGRAAVAVSVLPDARLRVREDLRFRYSDHPFSGAYRDIAVQPGATLSRFHVSDGSQPYADGASTGLGSDGDPGTFGTERLADGTERIVWHYAHSGGGHEDFRLGYLATGAAEAYDDVVLVHWAIWGDQWQFPLDELRGAVTLADPASGDGRPIDAWLTPARFQTKPTLTATGATAAVQRAPKGHQVVLSALFPRAAFRSVAGATPHVGDGRARIIAEQDAASSSAAAGFTNAVWRASGWIAALLAALAAAAMVVLLRRGRELPSSAPKHLPEPPEALSPAVAYAVATEGGYEDTVVLATLLDLVDRGLYTATPGSGQGGEDDRLDLVIAVGPRDAEATGALLPHERSVLDFFDGLIGDEPGALGALKDRIPKHDATWRSRWTAMNAELKKAGQSELEWARDLRPARAVAIVVVVAITGVVIALSYPRANEFYLPLLGAIWAAAFLLLPSGNALRRLTQASRDRQSRWAAFSRWTKDFPSLQDDPPATLLLWKRILIYGVAFGTAKKVIESGRIPEAVLAQASGTWWYGTGTGHTYGFMGGNDFAGSFSSGFSSQVASQSSSSGGGGGGGSSGGGGGGAW